ncbi:MAG: response regulator transcription factor [bacterium]
MKIRALLADKNATLRKQLRALLEKIPDLEVMGEADEGYAVVRHVKASQPDLVLMDIALTGLNGIEALRKIHVLDPRTRVIIVSLYAEVDYVRAALQAGARGFILKSQLAEELEKAVRAVLNDEIYVSGGIEPAP